MFLKKKISLCHVILLKGNGMLSCCERVVVRPAVRVQIVTILAATLGSHVYAKTSKLEF